MRGMQITGKEPGREGQVIAVGRRVSLVFVFSQSVAHRSHRRFRFSGLCHVDAWQQSNDGPLAAAERVSAEREMARAWRSWARRGRDSFLSLM